MRRILAVLSVLILVQFAARAETASDKTWTPAERWAWSQLSAGQPAEFDRLCQSSTSGQSSDAVWEEPCRSVRSEVVEQILTRSPWRDAMQHRGLWLIGARLEGDLDLTNAHVVPAVSLTHCRIEGDLRVTRARFDNLLALDGSVITGNVDGTGLLSDSDISLADGRGLVPKVSPGGGIDVQGRVSFRNAQIKGSLLLNRGHFEQMVDLRGAHVGGDVQTSGAQFTADLWGGSMQVGSKLSVNATHFVSDALFPDTFVGGLLDASDSAFEGKLNVVDSQIRGDLFVNRVLATKGLDISGSHIGGYVTLAGSTSKGAIIARNTEVSGNVQLDGGTHLDGVVTLTSIHVKGSLEMSKASFGNDVTLRDAHIEGDARIDHASIAHRLDMLSFHVEGDLLLKGTHVTDEVSAPNLDIGHDLVLDDKAQFNGTVNLFDARVANSIHMEHANFGKDLLTSNAQVAGDVRLVGAMIGGAAVLTRDRIGGDLTISGARISVLNLSGATVGGTLEVDSGTAWESPARLILVNATVGRLQDGKVNKLDRCPSDRHPPSASNGWPTEKTMALDGFVYGRIGSSAGSDGVNMRERDVCWWNWWLERDREFSSQPYVQLASVMSAHGDQENASRILYFARVRETQLAWDAGDYLRWIMLATLDIVAGYGVGTYTFRVLIWIIGLTAIGVMLLKLSPGGGKKTLWWRMGASLSRVLPGIEINREFADFFDDPRREHLKDWHVIVFSMIVLIGWVLGLFLVAAMTGLTQHT